MEKGVWSLGKDSTPATQRELVFTYFGLEHLTRWRWRCLCIKDKSNRNLFLSWSRIYQVRLRWPLNSSAHCACRPSRQMDPDQHENMDMSVNPVTERCETCRPHTCSKCIICRKGWDYSQYTYVCARYVLSFFPWFLSAEKSLVYRNANYGEVHTHPRPYWFVRLIISNPA